MPGWLTDRRLWLLLACIAGTVLLLSLPGPSNAGRDTLQATATPGLFDETAPVAPDPPPIEVNDFGNTLLEIAPVMMLAALLGGLVAYRRRMTVFEHSLFHAHILLSVAGALMMLIVGNQLVRAFGLLGAASVVRYRYGLRNPRDASMLIISLGIGMAAGVGLYALAVSAAAVVFVFARGLDFLGSRSNLLLTVTRPATLRVRTVQPEETMAHVERVLSQHNVQYRLRRYRRARKKKVDGLPVFTLIYTVHLDPGDNRARLTAELTRTPLLLARWKMQKPKKR